MGQSLSQLYIHLIFGTKNRQPIIKEELETKLHAYIAGILKNMNSPALSINSVPDHIHILFRLSKNYALAKIVEEIKKNSSKWVKTNFDKLQNFKWQIGYGAFSVSSSKIDIVKNYISNQKEHHKKVSFKEELENFLNEYNIVEYNEKYFRE